jgi:hypothetical protein
MRSDNKGGFKVTLRVRIPKVVYALAFVQMGFLSCSLPFSRAVSRSSNSIRLAVGTAPRSVELADLDHDGNLDIVVVNSGSDNVTILLGDGHGGFKPSPGSPFPAGHAPNDIAICDFDGDGNLDLAFPNNETDHVTVLLGDGHGGFRPAPQSPLTVQSKPHVHGIAWGDFNGDHRMGIAVESWQTNQVDVLFGDGHGGFATPGALFSVGRMPYQRLRAGDFNHDGYADIVTTNLEGDSVTILLSDGQGGFKEAKGSPFPAGAHPFGVAVGDVNKDGNLDLVVVNYSGHPDNLKDDGVTVLLGDGKGGFKIMPGSPFPTGSAPTRVAIGDINGDGIPDIVVCNSESQNVTVLPGNRKGTFGPGYIIPAGHGPNGIAVGDLDGDGKADIVVANSKDNDITVILNK